jgi:hypothetical protein
MDGDAGVESRTRFAIGGVSTVVASVAVVCAVALTNSVALADVAGAPVAATPIVVPSPSPSARAVAPAQPRVTRVAPTAETPAAEAVPAPAPIVVADHAATQVSGQTADQAVAEAEASGTWQPVRDWATRNQWSQERIDAWILRLEEKKPAVAEKHAAEQQKIQGETSSPSEDGGRLTASDSPKISAKAGPDAERQAVKPGLGAKKDRSRDSPDRRD